MATLQQLETALINADKAGDMDAARKLAAAITRARQDKSNLIPDAQIPETLPRPEEPGVVDNIIGAGEAALNLATGATGGTVGMLGGFVKGLATDDGQGTPQERLRRLENSVVEGAQALTYQPRTQAGQEQAEAIGEVLQNVIPIAPLAAETALLSRTAAPVATAARDTARVVPSAANKALSGIREKAPAIADRVQRTLGRIPEEPTSGTKGSVGSAGTDMALQRKMSAESLPVPIDLTKGQATRNPDQLRFEIETAKGDQGARLRERAAETNERFQRNFDAFVDQTGAQAVDAIDVGRSVDKAIRAEAARNKAEIRVAYTNADKSPEASAPVALIGAVDFLNESAPDAAVSPLLTAARARAIKMGIARETSDGNLEPVATTIKNAERFRRAIGEATDYESTNMRNAALIKGLIDAETESVAGPTYRNARRLRENYAKKYQNRAIVSSLLNTKRGMSDRKVALEDVFKDAILEGTREDMSYLRWVLHGSPEGKQAWRDLQGATVNWLKDEALKNVATDQRGNRIVSAAQLDKAVKRLEQGGKLDFVFGKKGAQTIRDLNDLAKVTMTVPPGSVNTSNTASVLLAALDMGISGAAGMPLPVTSGLRMLARYSKDRRIQKRIEEALGNATREPEPKSVPVKTPNRTLH